MTVTQCCSAYTHPIASSYSVSHLFWCVQDEAGDTALHLAVSKGHVPAVFHILSSEAAKDVTRWSLRNKCGRTAGELGPLP